METLFIEARYKGRFNLKDIKIEKLPERIGIATTVQFIGFLDKVKKYLEKNGKKIFTAKGKQKYKAQILGCDLSAVEKIKEKVDAFLYIGDGKFHPIGIAMKTGKEVFTFNPYTSRFGKISNKEIKKYEKRKKIALLKFYSGTNIGVLISLKPGQNFYKGKIKKLEEVFKDKKFYKFVFDTLDFKELENFNFIDAWVNCACPRIDEDIIVVNIDELKELKE